jgi:hypothetical protein
MIVNKSSENVVKFKYLGMMMLNQKGRSYVKMVKLSLCLIKHHAIKMYEGVEA